jgi:hypothetical protein
MKTINQLRISIKFLLKNGQTITYSSCKSRRIFFRLSRLKNFQRVYCKVLYGKGYDVRGRYTEFYNDGEYTNYRDLIYVLRIFLER